MDMQELTGYGVPAHMVALWRTHEGERLLPLQEKAVREYGLFGDGNLLVQAPTSSGKTFIGEMAAAHAALAARKTAYLLPLKALAEEKYEDFRAKYGPCGARVIVCTRDHRDFDAAFERGDFDIAVAVYEKLEQLAVSRPERLREVALVVADELELLSDPERGANVELLLTRLRLLSVRIVGLSAVLGAPDKLATWLNARLLEHERRPVELRYGVLFEGKYRYCGHNDHDEGEEELEVAPGETPWEQVALNVRRLAESGESCLVFVKARREAWRGAEVLARRLALPAATDTIETMRTLETTRVRDALLRALEGGVAFHSADLLPGERRAIEAGFRAGEIKALVATGTLAAGMNLPARNVFMSADKWVYDPRLDLPWRAPISRGEFENMSGRAGRYGVKRDPGRAILVAGSSLERDALWRRYVKGHREAVQPRLARAPLEDATVQLVASRCCRSLAELEAFFAQTLSARLVWEERHSDEEIGFRIRAALRRCLDAGAVRASDGAGATVLVDPDTPLDTLIFEVAPLGRVIAAKGVSLASARALLHWLRLSERRDWPVLDLLIALALLPDARLRQVSLSRREYEEADYPGRMKKATTALDIGADVPVNRLRNCRVPPFYDEARAIKAALFLESWMDESPLETLEAEFETTAGQIRDAADQISWLADSAAALAEAQGMTPAFGDALRDAADRVRWGVGEAILPVARAVAGLSRSALQALAQHGLTSPETLDAADMGRLEAWMDTDRARALKRWAAAEHCAEAHARPQEPTPVLVIDARRPGRVEVFGNIVALQDKQYRLLSALARCPGQCVPYAAIYRAVWGDVIVEDNQMHYQKRMLVKKLAAARQNGAALIGVAPKHGFILKLAPDQVRIIEATTNAA